jgi:hypothetical protein
MGSPTPSDISPFINSTVVTFVFWHNILFEKIKCIYVFPRIFYHYTVTILTRETTQ